MKAVCLLGKLDLEFAVLTWGPKTFSVFSREEPHWLGFTTNTTFTAAALGNTKKIAEIMALESLRSSNFCAVVNRCNTPCPLEVTQSFFFVKSASVWPNKGTYSDGKKHFIFFFWCGIHGPKSGLYLRKWATGGTGDESKTIPISLVEARVFLYSIITCKSQLTKEIS